MKAAFLKFVRDERGSTAIEYGIIAGLMAVALIAGFAGTDSIPAKLKSTFSYISTQLNSAAGTTTSSSTTHTP